VKPKALKTSLSLQSSIRTSQQNRRCKTNQHLCGFKKTQEHPSLRSFMKPQRPQRKTAQSSRSKILPIMSASQKEKPLAKAKGFHV
jgi:hypothetical protein